MPLLVEQQVSNCCTLARSRSDRYGTMARFAAVRLRLLRQPGLSRRAEAAVHWRRQLAAWLAWDRHQAGGPDALLQRPANSAWLACWVLRLGWQVQLC